MPATIESIRSALKICCIALVPLIAACGGGGGGGGGSSGSAVAATCGPATVAVAPPPAPAPEPPPLGLTLGLEQIGTFNAPLFVTAPPGDPTRLFVVEQGGTIQVVDRDSGAVIGTFLNISSRVSTGGDKGLLGLAFDPNYNGTTNRRFYVSYADVAQANLVIARYLVDPGNPNAALPDEERILTIPNPFENLYGGGLVFGPDGMLYITKGHGGDNFGTVGDPNNVSQNLDSLLGKLLRIDVSGAGGYTIPPDNPCVGRGRGEIWSMGLRNPWRFSFDQNGDLYIGDVGHRLHEEVNVSTAASGGGRGANYGWRIMEGKACFNPASGCNTANITQPVVDYTHSGGACSVIGGYVYRGSALPATLQGTYFYGDLCLGFVRSFRFNGQVSDHTNWPSLNPGELITSFGQDGQGELYITAQTQAGPGGVYRIVP